ncbi:unnamed protein product, partial [Thlaspi arvense]
CEVEYLRNGDETKKTKERKCGRNINEQKNELEWKPEHCAHLIGKVIKLTDEQGNKKCYYERFKFRGEKYGLEHSVLLFPEDASKEPYVAIIKKTNGFIVHKMWIKNMLETGNPKTQETSSKNECSVYFVPENKQVTNYGFIVQRMISRVGDLLDIQKKPHTSMSRRMQLVSEKFIKKVKRTQPENII